MKIKAIITGSTGMVGKGVLLECLENPQVESVLILNRHSIGLKHAKLKEIIHPDFQDFTSIAAQLRGFNACFFCLGVSAAGLSEPAYTRITYDVTLKLAETLVTLNPEMTFCYVSGTGTDHTEKSGMMWARVKGKTENALLKLPFKAVYLFRPGFIQPMKGIRSRTPLYNAIYMLLTPFYPLLKVFPKFATNTEKVGKAMINVVLKGYDNIRLENTDINLLASR
jgi:uncharacterized protein YbjT (DUF2867 family)